MVNDNDTNLNKCLLLYSTVDGKSNVCTTVFFKNILLFLKGKRPTGRGYLYFPPGYQRHLICLTSIYP